ncbi:MAG: cyclic nucleotide-binding domain-containing protein [Deltaproteobacteria bacterium]|nr:cyclic nucleotide-binding domain-containing protein [Deltaproteobacteria bacterium]
MLNFHARTDVGLKRKHNEDSLLAAEEFGVFVVADGVGGRKAGELASAITVNTFQGYAPQVKAAVDAFAADNTRETRNAVLLLLDQAANAASRRVYEAAAATGRQGMTTTLVAVAVGGGAAFVVHVGDSRAYLVRNQELRQLTDDHSMVNELIRRGEMTQDEAATSRYKNVITRAVGLYPTVKTDTLHVELLDGDRILLCSDGVTDMVVPSKILEILLEPDLVPAVDALVASALEGGGKDNITAIAIQPEAVLEAEAVVARAKAMEGLFLFQDLPFHARLRVGQIVGEVFVTPGQRVVRQGEPGDMLYVVVQGQFSIVVDGREIAVIDQGRHFGEISLVDSSPRTADIVAKGFGHLLTIDRDALRQYCMLEPALGNLMLWRLLESIAGRLRTATAQLGKA